MRRDDANDLFYVELMKQKQRLDTVKNAMEKQSEMLKLIVKKMEIKSEADEYDDEDIFNENGFKNKSNKMTHISLSFFNGNLNNSLSNNHNNNFMNHNNNRQKTLNRNSSRGK
jgi:hypothetical protein